MPVGKKFNGRNLVTTILLFILTGSLVLCVPGCGGGSPEKIVAKFGVAIADGDTAKAKNYCTQRFINVGLAGVDAAMIDVPDMSGSDKPSVSEMMEMLESTIDGDEAKVWVTDMEFMKYVLVKEGGTWKIDSIDMDLDAIEGMLEGI